MRGTRLAGQGRICWSSAMAVNPDSGPPIWNGAWRKWRGAR